MKRRPVLLALLIVGLANAVPLGVVVWDRSGPPRSVTEFSVRELTWSWTDDENTGIKLDWSFFRSSIDSASNELLDSLAFHCREMTHTYSCDESRRGYAMIGIDTAGWRADSARRVRVVDSLRRIGTRDTTYAVSELRSIGRESRLVVLGVALDRATLAAKWGEAWPILPASLDTWGYGYRPDGRGGDRISVQLVPSSLHLPTELRHLTRDFPQYRYNDSVPESFATVTVGRAGLPRITAVRWSDSTAP